MYIHVAACCSVLHCVAVYMYIHVTSHIYMYIHVHTSDVHRMTVKHGTSHIVKLHVVGPYRMGLNTLILYS